MSLSIRRHRPDRDEILAAIADELILLHARCCGSAPTPVRTAWDEDWVVCVLERALTKPERTLIAAGQLERVRADRQALREAVEPSLREAVEAVTGRRVRAYLTEVDPDDVVLEAFALGS